MKKSKRLIAAVMCCLCLLGTVQAVIPAASARAAYTPYWTTLSTITLAMSYSSGKVNWSGYISGNSNVTSITATYTLEKKTTSGSYSYVISWISGTANSYLDSSGSVTTAKGTYRLTVNVSTVTSGGATESTSTELVKTFT